MSNHLCIRGSDSFTSPVQFHDTIQKISTTNQDVTSERYLIFSGFCTINRQFSSIFFTFVGLRKHNKKWKILNIYVVGIESNHLCKRGEYQNQVSPDYLQNSTPILARLLAKVV